jgi:hypothetical protein
MLAIYCATSGSFVPASNLRFFNNTNNNQKEDTTMGEYAKYNGQEIKIGTCEEMFYLRYEDRTRVERLPNSLDPATETGLFFRLPFPDEDAINPGSYAVHNRAADLWPDAEGKSFDPGDIEGAGIIQLHHPCGLLVNATCHHGMKLPEESKELRAFWNGRDSFNFVLISVKNTEDGKLRAVFGCKHCGTKWSTDEWEKILPHVHDKQLRDRLAKYAATGEE